MRLSRRLTAAATTGVALAGTLIFASGPAQAQTAAPAFSCPYGALCIYGDDGGWHTPYFFCQTYNTAADGWYVIGYNNNQTKGTVARIWDDSGAEVDSTAPHSGSIDPARNMDHFKPC